MPTLFVALRPPPAFRDALGPLMHGVAGARWQDDAQLHVTVRYIGPVAEADVRDIVDALQSVHAPPAELAGAGVGVFDKGGRANALWVAVAPAAPLADLHRKVDRVLVAAGLPPERRSYRPHITVARIARAAARPHDIAAWLARHDGFATSPVTVGELILFESVSGLAGSVYQRVAGFPLLRL